MTNEIEDKEYELWSSEIECSHSFFPADNDSARDSLAPDAKLVCVIRATSWNEAQQKRYDFMGWGHYKTFEEEEAERHEKT
jgi:hypothetical protein